MQKLSPEVAAQLPNTIECLLQAMKDGDWKTLATRLNVTSLDDSMARFEANALRSIAFHRILSEEPKHLFKLAKELFNISKELSHSSKGMGQYINGVLPYALLQSNYLKCFNAQDAAIFLSRVTSLTVFWGGAIVQNAQSEDQGLFYELLASVTYLLATCSKRPDLVSSFIGEMQQDPSMRELLQQIMDTIQQTERADIQTDLTNVLCAGKSLKAIQIAMVYLALIFGLRPTMIRENLGHGLNISAIQQLPNHKSRIEAIRTSSSATSRLFSTFRQYGCLNCHVYLELKAKEDHTSPEAAQFKFCSGCSCAMYCSRACQTTDWKAGHKDRCSGRKKKKAAEMKEKA